MIEAYIFAEASHAILLLMMVILAIFILCAAILIPIFIWATHGIESCPLCEEERRMGMDTYNCHMCYGEGYIYKDQYTEEEIQEMLEYPYSSLY